MYGLVLSLAITGALPPHAHASLFRGFKANGKRGIAGNSVVGVAACVSVCAEGTV